MEVELANFISNLVGEKRPFEVSRISGGAGLKVTVPRSQLLRVCKNLKETEPYYFLHLSNICSFSLEASRFKREVLYQLYSYKLDYTLALAVRLEAESVAPGLAECWDSAVWLERKCQSVSGVLFTDLSQQTRGGGS